MTVASRRPIRIFITAGQVRDCTGARALVHGLPRPEWRLGPAHRNSVSTAGPWIEDRCRPGPRRPDRQWAKPCNPGRKPRSRPVRSDKRRYTRRNRTRIMVGRPKDWRRVATRSDRSPTVFLSAIARAATVLFWPKINESGG